MFKDITNIENVSQHKKNYSYIVPLPKLSLPLSNRLRTGSSYHQITLKSKQQPISLSVSHVQMKAKSDIFPYGEEILEYNLSKTYNYREIKFDLIEIREVMIKMLWDCKEKFKFGNQTIFHSILLFDRMLSQRKLTNNQLKPLLICCLVIGMKIQEQYPPLISELCTIGNIKQSTVLNLEMIVLDFFNFQIQNESIIFYLNILAHFSSIIKQAYSYLEFLICKFTERTLILSLYPQLAIFAIINIAFSTIKQKYTHLFNQTCIISFLDLYKSDIENVQLELREIYRNLMKQKQFTLQALAEIENFYKMKINI